MKVRFFVIGLALALLGGCAKYWTREDFDALENKTFVVSAVELTVTSDYGTKDKVLKLLDKSRFTDYFILSSFCAKLENNMGITVEGQGLLTRNECYTEMHDSMAREYHQIKWTNSVTSPNHVEFTLLMDLYESATFYIWIDIFSAGENGKSVKVNSFKYTKAMYDEAYSMNIDDMAWYQSLAALPYIVYKNGRESVYLDGSPAPR